MIRYQRHDVLYVPKDVRSARIDHRSRQPRLGNNPAFTRFYPAKIKRQPPELSGKPIGFIIHAHCWALLTQRSGVTFSQTWLQKFIRAARKYWYKNRLWGINSSSYLVQHQPGFQGAYGGVSDRSHVRHSPLIIPEIRDAIERANNLGITSNGTSFKFTKLPCELKLMILDFVCPLEYKKSDLQDTRNLLIAFGWSLPGYFWRSRFPPGRFLPDRFPPDERLVFEVKTLKATSLARWHAFFLDLAPVFSNRENFLASGLANRERVLAILDGIFSIMEKGSVTTRRSVFTR